MIGRENSPRKQKSLIDFLLMRKPWARSKSRRDFLEKAEKLLEGADARYVYEMDPKGGEEAPSSFYSIACDYSRAAKNYLSARKVKKARETFYAAYHAIKGKNYDRHCKGLAGRMKQMYDRLERFDSTDYSRGCPW